MTEAEVLAFLGLPDPLPGGRRLRPDIAAAMAAVPAPHDDESTLRAFAAFLEVVGPAPRVLAEEGFTCPRCGRTSYRPEDRRHGWCGACHEQTGAGVP